eukprot:1160510-Pelagomonas_calceolata.AAC.3
MVSLQQPYSAFLATTRLGFSVICYKGSSKGQENVAHVVLTATKQDVPRKNEGGEIHAEASTRKGIQAFKAQRHRGEIHAKAYKKAQSVNRGETHAKAQRWNPCKGINVQKCTEMKSTQRHTKRRKTVDRGETHAKA